MLNFILAMLIIALIIMVSIYVLSPVMRITEICENFCMNICEWKGKIKQCPSKPKNIDWSKIGVRGSSTTPKERIAACFDRILHLEAAENALDKIRYHLRGRRWTLASETMVQLYTAEEKTTIREWQERTKRWLSENKETLEDTKKFPQTLPPMPAPMKGYIPVIDADDVAALRTNLHRINAKIHEVTEGMKHMPLEYRTALGRMLPLTHQDRSTQTETHWFF